jgi:hypothetical protein
MTPDQIEDILERAAAKFRDGIREDFRVMMSGLGFNMDPDKAHEEQQMVAFMRTMHQGSRLGVRAAFTAIITAAIGWGVWFFTGRGHT